LLGTDAGKAVGDSMGRRDGRAVLSPIGSIGGVLEDARDVGMAGGTVLGLAEVSLKGINDRLGSELGCSDGL
jgi:hypothetical protein